MAEQLIGFGYLDEGNLMKMNVTKVRKDIATSLISNSGNHEPKVTVHDY